jgi:hypothetical protein
MERFLSGGSADARNLPPATVLRTPFLAFTFGDH